jgi:hypothetical protein
MRFQSIIPILFAAGAVAQAMTEISDQQLDVSSVTFSTTLVTTVTRTGKMPAGSTDAVISAISDGQIQAPVQGSIVAISVPVVSTTSQPASSAMATSIPKYVTSNYRSHTINQLFPACQNVLPKVMSKHRGERDTDLTRCADLHTKTAF